MLRMFQMHFTQFISLYYFDDNILCLTLWRLLGFVDFQKKKPPKRTWLCAEISPVRYVLQTQ